MKSTAEILKARPQHEDDPEDQADGRVVNAIGEQPGDGLEIGGARETAIRDAPYSNMPEARAPKTKYFRPASVER